MSVFQPIFKLLVNRKNRWVIIIFGSIALALISWLVGTFIPEHIDWIWTYWSAERELIAFHNPYNIKPPVGSHSHDSFCNSSGEEGNGLLFFVSFCTKDYSIFKMGAKPLILIVFLILFLYPSYCFLVKLIGWFC